MKREEAAAPAWSGFPERCHPSAHPGHPAGPPFPPAGEGVSHFGACGAALPPHTLIINLQRSLPVMEAAPSPAGPCLPLAASPGLHRPGREPGAIPGAGCVSRLSGADPPPGARRSSLGLAFPRAASPGDGTSTRHSCRQRFPPRRFPLETAAVAPQLLGFPKNHGRLTEEPFSFISRKSQGGNRRRRQEVEMLRPDCHGYGRGRWARRWPPLQHLETCREPMGK